MTDSLLHNQRAYAFQKGDTVAFSITYHAPSFDSPNSSYAYVARPDQYVFFKPDLYNGMPQYLLKSESLRKDQPQSGSFIANNDGVFGFYFQEKGKYNVRIVRHPGANGDPTFTLPIEWGQVLRTDLGLYVEEPIMR